ncbi:unnamed protein product [Adineta steineri]|uniref:Uncharacterized protein n=1 Tax=Adineta steineri TaxID=433720 RepID=A0A816BNN5_9BILA|nr:unnamed protein product [Adineta steineri]CAF1393038.1 unnamed protein product [Adineta steineri]CAF1611705.1 unnamed protein product [Adineta steineri]CAF1611755.1 unnamed protein product [Adineta steineri]
MQSNPVTTIKMYYNSMPLSYFEFPLSSNRTHFLSCSDNFKMSNVKEHIARLYTNYNDNNNIGIITSMDNETNFTINHPILISVLVLLLLIMTILIIYLKRYSVRRQQNEENECDSFDDNEKIYATINNKYDKSVILSFNNEPSE